MKRYFEQDALIEKEISDGIIPDPNEPVDPQTGQPIGDLGAPIQEPDLESEGWVQPKHPLSLVVGKYK